MRDLITFWSFEIRQNTKFKNQNWLRTIRLINCDAIWETAFYLKFPLKSRRNKSLQGLESKDEEDEEEEEEEEEECKDDPDEGEDPCIWSGLDERS